MSAVMLAIFSWIAPKLADRPVELLALVGILDAFDQGHLGGAGDACAQLETADIEDVEGDLMALADLTQHVLHRNLAVVEDDLGGRRPLDAHLFLLGADDQPLEVLAPPGRR